MALPVFAEEANGDENGYEYENGYEAGEEDEDAEDEDAEGSDEEDYDEDSENEDDEEDEDDEDEYVEIEPIAEPLVHVLTVEVDGVEVEFVDQGPVMVDNRVLVPVRGAFDAMGFDEPEWNRSTREATLTRGDVEIIIPADGTTFTVNGETVTPDVPQRMMNGRVMLPLSAIADAVGATHEWDNATQTAQIFTVVEEEPVDDEDYDEEDEEYDEDADDDEEDADEEDDTEDEDTDEEDMPFADHPLVGTWANDELVYVFYGDLTGTVTRDDVVYEMEWVAFEGTLTLRVPGFDLIGISMWEYSIEDDVLTLDNAVTDEVVVLTLEQP